MSRHETQVFLYYACFVTKVTQMTVRGRPYLERSLDECQIFAAPLKITTVRTFFVSNESTRAGPDPRFSGHFCNTYSSHLRSKMLLATLDTYRRYRERE